MFSKFLNDSSEFAFLQLSESEFHKAGPALGRAWSPAIVFARYKTLVIIIINLPVAMKLKIKVHFINVYKY